MPTPFSILACGNVLSPRDEAIIFGIIGGWLVSFVLTFVNLALITVVPASNRFKRVNFVIFLIYFILGLLLLVSNWDALNYPAMLIAVPLVPVFSISHFVYLFGTWKRLRRSKVTSRNPEKESLPPASDPTVNQ